MSKKSEKGSALAAAVVIVIAVTGISVAMMSATLPMNERSANLNEQAVASYAAEGVLEWVRMEVAESSYDADGNMWLMDNSSYNSILDPEEQYPQENDMTVYQQPLQVAKAEVSVWLYRLDNTNTFYRAIARATVGTRTVTLAQDIRGRDTFARYMRFVSAGNLSYGDSVIHGAVHSNQRINFGSSNAEFHGDVSAVQGFTGTTPNFFGATNDNADYVPLPSTSEIEAIGQFASGNYYVGSNRDAEITFLGNQVQIVEKSGSTVLKSGTYPLPPDGVIYVEGYVTSVKGDVNGKVTVATTRKITVKGAIRYVDNEGDVGFQLKHNGSVISDTQSTGTDAWRDYNGYTYEPNENYSGKSVVGLMSADQVYLDSSCPYNLEIHAALYAAQNSWYASTSQQKGNLVITGSIVTNKGGVRYSGSYGWAKSGNYIYDESLQENPPPAWLPVDKPVWGARFKVGKS